MDEVTIYYGAGLGRAASFPEPGRSEPARICIEARRVENLRRQPDVAVRPPAGGPLTAQGHPRAIFRRAIERGTS